MRMAQAWVLVALPIFVPLMAFVGLSCVAQDPAAEDAGALSRAPLRAGSFLLGQKEVILTFDDGPGPSSTALADRLAAKGVPATFFMVGSNVAKRPADAARIASLGFSLGNHTENHAQRSNDARGKRGFYDLCRDAAERGDQAVFEEIRLTHTLLVKATGVAPTFLRTPGGSWFNPDPNGAVQNPCATVLAVPFSSYVGPVGWDVGGGSSTENYLADHACTTVDLCVKSYMRELAARDSRGVILLHDVAELTVKPDGVADRLVAALLSEGYKIKDMRGAALGSAQATASKVSAIQDPDPNTSYVPSVGSSCGGTEEACIWSKYCAAGGSPRCVVTGSSCTPCGQVKTPSPGEACGRGNDCIWSSDCAKGKPSVCVARGMCSACVE